MIGKNVIRFLILAVLLASSFIMALSTNAFHPTKLSLSAKCRIGNAPFFAFWDSKTYATAEARYSHPPPFAATKILGAHTHTFSYSLYARVADDVDRNPPQLPNGNIPYGNMSVLSSTNFWASYKSIFARASGYPQDEKDAEATASVSETPHSGNWDPTNWDFCPKPQ